MTTTPSAPGTAASALVTLAARVVLAGAIFMLFLAAAPALIGWNTGVILTGSMSPALTPGDVVVSEPGSTVRPGQLAAVDDPRRPGHVLVHRVVRVTAAGDLITKGDANQVADSTPVPPERVRGVVRFTVPAIGLAAVWLHEGDVIALAAGAGALLLFAWLATVPAREASLVASTRAGRR